MRSLGEYKRDIRDKLIGKRFYHVADDRVIYRILKDRDRCVVSWVDDDNSVVSTDFGWDEVIDFFKSGVWILID